jgi:CheY-like chemotaxis protein
MAEPPVDLLLVDQFMPRLDGWGLLHALRSSEQGSTVPVMLISAAPAQRPDGFPEDMAFDQFVMKPVAELQLASLLGELLGLQWEYGVDAGGEEPPAIDPSWLTALDADERERFTEMVAIGQVLGLQRWAQDMVQRHPEQEASWRGIEQLCRRVDLPALKRLAEAVATE